MAEAARACRHPRLHRFPHNPLQKVARAMSEVDTYFNKFTDDWDLGANAEVEAVIVVGILRQVDPDRPSSGTSYVVSDPSWTDSQRERLLMAAARNLAFPSSTKFAE